MGRRGRRALIRSSRDDELAAVAALVSGLQQARDGRGASFGGTTDEVVAASLSAWEALH